MDRKRYSLVPLSKVNLESLTVGRQGQRCVVGIDVSKKRPVVCLMWPDGEFARPWVVRAPQEVGLLIQLLVRLGARGEVVLAMESTGTYGDALRQAAFDAGLEVHQVLAKAVKDSAESFDGAPSQHDGKDSAVIADLCLRGKSRVWEFVGQASGEDGELRYWMRRHQGLLAMDRVLAGQQEALMARHWPEVDELLDSGSATLLGALAHWGDPRALAADASAGRRLALWGGALLKPAKIQALIESAGRTCGVRMSPWEVREVRDLARQRRKLHRESERCRKQMEQLAEGQQQIQRQRQAVGLLGAVALWMCLQAADQYPCAAAYRKAMGLNLTEHSSGKYQGPLHISRRGPRLVRQLLYFAALRAIRDHACVREWVERKKAREQGSGGKAVVAVMRKLALAAWHLARTGEAFDPARLWRAKGRARSARAVAASGAALPAGS